MIQICSFVMINRVMCVFNKVAKSITENDSACDLSSFKCSSQELLNAKH